MPRLVAGVLGVSQRLGGIINLPLATVGHRDPGSGGLVLRESRQIKVKVKLINQTGRAGLSWALAPGEGLGAPAPLTTCGRRSHNQNIINRYNTQASKSISASC